MKLGRRRQWTPAIAGLGLILLAHTGHADDLGDCNGNDTQRIIDGCSAIIDRRTESAASIAIAYNNRGNAYSDKGEIDWAIEDYDRAIALDPKYPLTYYNRGNAFSKRGDIDLAIKDYDRAIALDPKLAQSYYNRGTAFSKRGDTDRAIEDYDRAIALDPKLTQGYNNRGYSYYLKREYDRAIDDYDRAIALDPRFVQAYANRGTAYGLQGDHGRAIEDFDRIIALNPEYSQAYYNRGYAYQSKGDTDKAINDYGRAIALDPKQAKYLNARCWVRAVAGTNLNLARADCDAALALTNNEPNTLDSRGLVGIKQGLFDKAWADYDTAHRAKPDNAGFLYGRGIAALRLGRTEEGKSDLVAALMLDRKIAETYSGYGVPAP